MKYINKNRILGMDIKERSNDWIAIVYLQTTEHTQEFTSKAGAESYINGIVNQANNSLFVCVEE